MRILYVEDNPANLFLIKRVAKMGDHEVVNLIDGEEALRKIDLIKPDLILMDIQLAGQLTGLDVVRKLRSDGYAMPIVAVTAYAMVGDRERCLEAGCNEYLSKPLPIGRVVELLQLYQAGVPAPAPKNEDDSSTNIPILTRPSRETSENKSAQAAPVAASPAVVETPAAPATSATPASSDAAPAAPQTPAAPVNAVPAPSTTTPETVTPPAPVDAVQASPAGDAPAAPEQPSAVPPVDVAPAKDDVTPQDAVVLPTPVSAEGTSDAGLPPASVTGSGDASPTVESTSQDTSHPQDTVPANK